MKCEHMTCYQCTDAEVTTLRTTLARLTAELAAVTSDRDMWRSECESISAELDLPPGMRPMEGELRRMLEHSRALIAERDEARSDRDEAHTRGYAAGYQMGVRESSDVNMEMSKLVAERHRQRREQGRVMMWESTAVEARTGALREASNEILKLLDAEPALRCTALYGGGVSGGSRCKKRQGHASLHSWERGEQ